MKKFAIRNNSATKVGVLLLLVALMIGMLPAAAFAQSSDSPQATSLVRALNVRSGPGLNYSVIGTLGQDQSLPITGRNAAGSWWQVKLADGRQGWVTGQTNLVSVSGDTSQIPQVAAPAAPAARPAAAARGGQFAFQTSSGGQIYLANADGSGLRKLTTGIDPALSPDGKQVAFTRWDSSTPGTKGSVWVINTDGSGEKMVHSDVRQPKSPTWSPDGNTLMINMQQGGTLEPSCYCAGWLSWRPGPCPNDPPLDSNGREVACYEDLGRAGWGLRAIDLPTGQWQDQKRDFVSFTPAWDPINAWRVVFNGDRGLAQLDVNRQVSWPLTTDVNDRSPNFSPDGQKIAVSYHQHDHWDVHTMNANGDGRARITETPWSVTAAGKPVWNNVAPAYSPDSKRIVFLTDRTGQWELWTMNADGGNPKPVFPSNVQTSLGFQYNFADERVVSWR